MVWGAGRENLRLRVMIIEMTENASKSFWRKTGCSFNSVTQTDFVLNNRQVEIGL